MQRPEAVPMMRLMVAGTSSGVGKTTVTLALIALLRHRRLQVQPFKGGPDFLDTTHHTRIAGRSARNLDTWMLTPEVNRDIFTQASCGADAAIVEGMMGLFDGKEALTDTGSSAEIAKLLQLPVLLVIDAAKSARSLAAAVLGFELFDPALPLAGVILNRVGSERHAALLTSAIKASCRTPVLGWLPREPRIAIPERHLGLYGADLTAGNDSEVEEQIDLLASIAEQHFDTKALLELGRDLAALQRDVPQAEPPPLRSTVRIGVARDAAFSFYYEDNLDLLRAAGAEIVAFSPIHDTSLPTQLDALYLGGGYPELHARELGRNHSMLADLRAFASNRPIYAECGGMLYLGESLTTADGTVWPMAAALPLRFEMTSRLVDFGYVTVMLTQDTLLGPAGTELRGHSFHYSRVSEQPALRTSYDVQFSLSGKQMQEGFLYAGILATYVHLHFRTHPAVAANFVAAAVRSRSSQEIATA